MCSRLSIPQRNITILSCRRKVSPIWRYSKQSLPTYILVAPVTESIVNTGRMPITILLPALGPKLYFAQEWRPLPPLPSHHSYRAPDHTFVHSIQCRIARHSQTRRTIDVLRSVHESISTLQEPSVPVVQQLLHTVVQFPSCLYQLVVSHCIVQLMHTYRPTMHVPHHQDCAWHLSQQAHSLHPVQQPPMGKLSQQRQTLSICLSGGHHLRCPV